MYEKSWITSGINTLTMPILSRVFFKNLVGTFSTFLQSPQNPRSQLTTNDAVLNLTTVLFFSAIFATLQQFFQENKEKYDDS